MKKSEIKAEAKAILDDIREAANDGPAGFVPKSGIVKIKIGPKEKARYVERIVALVERARA